MKNNLKWLNLRGESRGSCINVIRRDPARMTRKNKVEGEKREEMVLYRRSMDICVHREENRL